MVGIILATHGDFAKGILQSGSMIFGDQPNVAACTLQPSMGPEDIKKQMADLKFIYVTSTEETALNKLELFKDNWAPCPLISGIQKP